MKKEEVLEKMSKEMRVLKVVFVAPTHKGRAFIPPNVDLVVSDVSDFRGVLERPDLLVAFISSGGTSRLVAKFVEYYGVERVLLISHPGFNSLASALDARPLLHDLGCRSSILHIRGVEELQIVDRIVDALRGVYGVKAALLYMDERPPTARPFERLVNGVVANFSRALFEELLENAPGEYIDEFVRRVGGLGAFQGGKALEDIGRVYAVIRRLWDEGYRLFAINCFPFLLSHGYTPCLALAVLNANGIPTACEADLQALLLMAISRHITGHVGFMANVNDVNGDRAFLSHCTAPLSLLEGVKFTTHFETGLSHALTGRFKFEDVTIASISRDFKYATIWEGRVVESGLLRSDVCRVQIVVKASNIERIVDKAPYNHHVIMPGRALRMVKAVLELLGVRTEVLS